MTCDGCFHKDICGYFDPIFFEKEWDWSEEERFNEHCMGCCCGDLADCNYMNNCGCDNYEEEFIMG